MESINLKIILIIFFSIKSFAQVTFVSKISQDTIGYNQNLKVDFIANRDGDNWSFPNFENFEVLSGPLSSISQSWSNGRRTFKKSFKYIIKPKNKGQLVIPAASCEINGRIYKTLPLIVNVSSSISEIKKSNKKEKLNLKKSKANEILSSKEKLIVIPMQENSGGTFTIDCKINGLKLNFIFDTGASNVYISLTEALFMFKNGYLNKNDIKGTEYYSIANGDIEEGTVLNIRELEFGGQKLKNVKASVISELKAPLLLGQSRHNSKN